MQICCLKLRTEKFGAFFYFSLGCVVMSIMGMGLGLAGIAELPKCKAGDPVCYYLIRVCADNYENTNLSSFCVLMSKSAMIEGSTNRGVEKLAVAIFASVLGIIPAFNTLLAFTINNKRALLALLESNKLIISISLLVLLGATVTIERLTFDCRWHASLNRELHKPHPFVRQCQSGFSMFLAGSVMLCSTEFVLLLFCIIGSESERRKVEDAQQNHMVTHRTKPVKLQLSNRGAIVPM